MTKKTILIVIIFAAILSTLLPLSGARASDNVQLNVSVLARKPTDTINDFDFSFLNIVPAQEIDTAQQQPQISPTKSFFSAILATLSNLV